MSAFTHGRAWREWQHPRDQLGQFADKRTGWLRRIAQATRRGEFTDAELAGREKEVNAEFTAAHPMTTSRLHRTPEGRWTDERARIHRQVVDEIWARHAHVPADRQAILTGGLAGAGKTTVLEGHAGVDQSQYLVVSADEMKDELTKRGLVPTVPGWEHLSPMEHSTLIHAETVHMADMLGERAYAAGKNVIYDSSMGGRQGPADRIARMREHGYATRGIFVDIPVETSVERATSRYRYGQRQWLSGEGPGGRPIPPAFILAQRGSGGSTVNREVFQSLASEGLFDRWEIYDNSGRSPVLVARGGGEGERAVRASDLARQLELLGGQYEAYNPRGQMWVPLVELRQSERAADKWQVREWGVSGRNPNAPHTVPGFTIHGSELLRIRPRQQ